MKVGIIGDIHEDIVALRAAVCRLEKEGCSEVMCLGDIVGYKVNAYRYLDTRNAHECIALVRANCNGSVLIGNNDLFQIKKVPQHRGGFNFPPDWYTLDFFERKALAKDRLFLYEDVQLSALLTKADKAYLESLPDLLVRSFGERKVMFSHFAYPDLHGMQTYFPKRAEEFLPHLSFIRDQGCDLGFSGHMHFEGLSRVSEFDITRDPFGTYELSGSLEYAYGPCIARGPFRPGILVYDTDSGVVHALALAID